MFRPEDILYEDNHLLVVNKHTGDLVQPAPEGGPSLEEEIKAFIKRRDHKPGNVFLGVAHRIDRPVSGAVVMAKTSKALARLGEMIRERRIAKTYWAIVESLPAEREATLRHWLWRDGRTNITHVVAAPGERPGLAGAENGTASASAARPVGERDGERLRSTARSTFPQPARPTDRSPQPAKAEAVVIAEGQKTEAQAVESGAETQTTAAETQPDTSAAPATPSGKNNPDGAAETYYKRSNAPSNPPAPRGRKENRAGKMSLLLALNGVAPSGGENQNSMMGADAGSPGSGITVDGWDDPVTGDPTKTRPIQIKNPSYDFPVSFTLTLRKNITGRLAVETGLSYTILHTTGSGNSGTVSEIKLYYLGIPFKALYTFYSGRTVSFYGGAGGMAEMQVAGKITGMQTTMQNVDDHLLAKQTVQRERNLDNSRVQWSLGASAGMNVGIGKRMGVFVEPGVAYFFDDGSGIPTIRKDKPLNFNLQLGLRFNLN